MRARTAPTTSTAPRTGRRRIGALATGAVTVALVAGACGGGSSGSGTPNTAEGLERAARSYADLVVAGDWKSAYDYMTEECRSDKTRSEFVVEAGLAVEMAKAFGMDFSKLEVTDVQVRDVADGRGEVLTIGEIDGEPLSDEETWEPWVYEGDGWRSVDCGMDDSGDSGLGDSTDSDDSTGTTVGGELRPSDEAQADKELDAATIVSLGESADLGDGISVTVTSIALGSAYGDPAVAVTLRVENRGEDSQNPDVGVRCAGSTDDGMASSDGSTYETWADLPSGSFSEGVINVLPPSGQPCEGPAYVWITPTFSFDDTAVAVAIDDALLAQLQA